VKLLSASCTKCETAIGLYILIHTHNSIRTLPSSDEHLLRVSDIRHIIRHVDSLRLLSHDHLELPFKFLDQRYIQLDNFLDHVGAPFITIQILYICSLTLFI